MTFVDTFTPMAEHLRNEYGITDKLSPDQLKIGINGLHSHNLLQEGRMFDSQGVHTGENVDFDEITIAEWNKLSGKKVTVSMDISWSNYHPDDGLRNRVGFELGISYKDGSSAWINTWLTPDTASGTKHIVNTHQLPNSEVKEFIERGFYNQVNSDCVFKATNLRIVENPVGGVAVLSLVNPYFSKWSCYSGGPGDVTFDNGGLTVVMSPNSKWISERFSVSSEAKLNWSYEAKADVAGDKIHNELFGGGGFNDTSLHTEWEAFHIAGAPNKDHGEIYFWSPSSNIGKVYLRNLKFYTE